MHVETLTTSDLSLIRGVRATLEESESALLCVAFVHERGLYLVQKELERRRRDTRLLLTTTFGNGVDPAVGMARGLGVDVRVLNPGQGTYHPKLYLGRTGRKLRAVIGSANLTSGLTNNVEVAVGLQGTLDDAPLARAWDWAESLWDDPRAQPYTLLHAAQPTLETFAPDLYPLLQEAVREDRTFRTLGPKAARNVVLDLSRTELLMQTEKSPMGAPIPAWMFNLAWDFLKQHGALSNKQLLEDLRVMRSSAVCAVLARLPHIEASGKGGITLRWRDG